MYSIGFMLYNSSPAVSALLLGTTNCGIVSVYKPFCQHHNIFAELKAKKIDPVPNHRPVKRHILLTSSLDW
jgi:hypothetical protein